MTDRDEILRLLLKSKPMLCAYMYTLLENRSLVEDAFQETAVYVCNHWSEFTPGTNFKAWFRKVAEMRCREIFQKEIREGKGRAKVREHLLRQIPDAVWDRCGDFNSERKDALIKCLEGLPTESRGLLVRYYLKRQKGEGIAAELQKNVEAIYMSLSRIRRRLKECVERRMQGEAA